jgi:hypothetical protein
MKVHDICKRKKRRKKMLNFYFFAKAFFDMQEYSTKMECCILNVFEHVSHLLVLCAEASYFERL